MRMFSSLIFGLIITPFASLAGTGVTPPDSLNILAIAGKDKSSVAKTLGEPSECSQIKYGEKCIYPGPEIDVVFIKGKADWITLNKTSELDFKPETITKLGLESAKPSWNNEHEIRWEGIQGLKLVKLAPSGEKIFFIYVKVSTD